MLKIRLKRVGTKKQPTYRIVVAEARTSRAGLIVEQLGLYDPKTNPPTVTYDEDKVLKWIRNGAQPTDSVARMLKSKGTLDKVKVTVTAEAPAT